MKKILFVCMMIVFAIMVLVGCGSEQSGDSDKEIVLAAARDLAPGEKDPYFTSSILQVWEPLIALGNDGEPQPMLATSWEPRENGTVWLFHLRQGVTFHDGTPFNAAAVLSNFERWAVMGYKASTFYSTSLEKMYPHLLTWEALDEYTLKLTFAKPMPNLPYLMTSWNSPIFSPTSLNLETGDFRGFAQGTGPFKLVEVVKNQYTVIERNENYWGEKAKSKRVRVKVIPTPETRFSAMKSGEIMGVVDLGGLTPALAKELSKDSQFALDSHKMTITHYLTVQGDTGPFKDMRLKRALSLAIDREAIVKQYFYNYATPTVNLINSASPFGCLVKPEYNPEKAKTIVDEISQGKTIKVRYLIPQYGTERYPYKEISEWIQADLAKIGIEATIQIIDKAAYNAAMRDGAYDMAIHTRGLAVMEPGKLLTEWMSSKADGTLNKGNHIGYYNAEAQQLIDSIPTLTDMDKMKSVYFRLQDIALEYPVTIPLFEEENLLIHNKRIRGFKPTIYGVTLSEMEWVK